MEVKRGAAVSKQNQSAATNKHKSNYQAKKNSYQGSFVKSNLESPEIVISKLGIKIVGVNNNGYLILKCPFHKNGLENNPSLNLHTKSGHYVCHACGAKGGDILAFYQAVTGKGFREAAIDLGAWRL